VPDSNAGSDKVKSLRRNPCPNYVTIAVRRSHHSTPVHAPFTHFNHAGGCQVTRTIIDSMYGSCALAVDFVWIIVVRIPWSHEKALLVSTRPIKAIIFYKAAVVSEVEYCIHIYPSEASAVNISQFWASVLHFGYIRALPGSTAARSAGAAGIIRRNCLSLRHPHIPFGDSHICSVS
jgi:hypothetical protein